MFLPRGVSVVPGVRVKGVHSIDVRDAKGNRSEAILEIRYRRIRVLPPIGKQQRYPETTLYVIHAQERGTPKRRERIEWKLITDLPVTSRVAAIEKLNWYAARWKIETFHKILKSGCKAEASKLRTAARLLAVKGGETTPPRLPSWHESATNGYR